MEPLPSGERSGLCLTFICVSDSDWNCLPSPCPLLSSVYDCMTPDISCLYSPTQIAGQTHQCFPQCISSPLQWWWGEPLDSHMTPESRSSTTWHQKILQEIWIVILCFWGHSFWRPEVTVELYWLAATWWCKRSGFPACAVLVCISFYCVTVLLFAVVTNSFLPVYQFYQGNNLLHFISAVNVISPIVGRFS